MKKKPDNFLDYVPRHNVNFPFDMDKNGIVTIHITWKGPFHKIASTLFRKPKESHIELDKLGSFIWNEIDGERRVQEICEIFKNAYPEEEDHLKRLVQYLKILRNNEFIVYNVPLDENRD